MQYEVTEFTDISIVSIKELFSNEKTKQDLTQFVEKQVINHLRSQDISFTVVVAGNGRTHIKNSNCTVDVASNNHEESSTCAIAWDLWIWRIKLYVSSQMILMYLLLCLATMKN